MPETLRDNEGNEYHVEQWTEGPSNRPTREVVTGCHFELRGQDTGRFFVSMWITMSAMTVWKHQNPDLPFCPGARLPRPERRQSFTDGRFFGGALGVVEALLEQTDIRSGVVLKLCSDGAVSRMDTGEAVVMRNGRHLRVNLALPEGSTALVQ